MAKRNNKNKKICTVCDRYINGSHVIHTHCVETYVRKILRKSIIVTIFDDFDISTNKYKDLYLNNCKEVY